MNTPISSATAHAGKRLARLAAVQVLYQNNYEQEPLKHIIRANIEQNFPALNDVDDVEPLHGTPDTALFGDIVQGVADNMGMLDEMIAGTLDAKFSATRLEVLLRTILRAGTYELHQHGQIPAGVIINDYVDVAHAFFNGKEPGLINGMLDKLAHTLRNSQAS